MLKRVFPHSKHEGSKKNKQRVTHPSYTLFCCVLLCLCLSVSFNLLEVGILDVVVGVRLSLLTALEALASGLLATGLGTSGLAVHLLRGGLHHLIQVVDGAVDGGDVARLVGILQLLDGLLDIGLVGSELVTILVEEGLCLEDHRVGLVHLVDALTFTLVGFCVLLGLSLHAVDLVLRQTAGSLDADGLLLAGSLVLSADLQDAVGIDVEGYLNLRNAAACGSDAGEVELADRLILSPELPTNAI